MCIVHVVEGEILTDPSATAPTPLLPVLVVALRLEVATRASVVALAATPVLPLATSAVGPTTLPVTARLRP